MDIIDGLYAYKRILYNKEIIVIGNITGKVIDFDVEEELLLSNTSSNVFLPYAFKIFKKII